MKRFEYTVTAPQGIHGRPAAELVKLAKQYQSTVTLQCGERSCDVKQLIKLMLAAVKQGETVCITVSGMDEEACAAALEKAMQKDF